MGLVHRLLWRRTFSERGARWPLCLALSQANLAVEPTPFGRGTPLTLDAVRASLISLAAAGAVCLPATYRFTRYGSLGVSIAIVVTVAALSTWLALRYVSRSERDSTWWSLAIAFCGGVVLSETLFFAYYYFDYGYADRKLSVGIALTLIEGGAIALLGCLSVVAAYFARRRLTSTSRATR